MAAAPAEDPALGDGTFDNAVALVSADARYDVGPFMFRGVVANVSIADAEAINAAFGGQVGQRIAGGYLEGAYNLLSKLAPAAAQQLNAFVRHERYNTQAGVPGGVTRDDALARRITTLGLSYKPVYNVVFKGDYQIRRNGPARARTSSSAWGWGISSRRESGARGGSALLAAPHDGPPLLPPRRAPSPLRPPSWPSRSSACTAPGARSIR